MEAANLSLIQQHKHYNSSMLWKLLNGSVDLSRFIILRNEDGTLGTASNFTLPTGKSLHQNFSGGIRHHLLKLQERLMMQCFHDGESVPANATDTPDDETLLQIKHISYGIVLTLICSFGIIGNILNLVVLTRQRFKAIMYIYLRWMAFADLHAAIFVIIYILRNGWGVTITTFHAAYYYAHFAVPIINIFLVSSSLMVVIITLERYLSTCHPIKSRSLVTPLRAKVTACLAYLISFFLYIPMAFEFQVTRIDKVPPDFSTTNRTLTEYHPCYNKEFADSYFYANVYKTVQVTITKFLPIATISVLNTLTLLRFRKIVARHHALTNKSRREKKQFDEEYRLTIMLICVVLVYILCLVPNTLAWLIRSSDKQQLFSFQVFIIIADMLEVVNSSLNFYMYCMASTDFRKHFRNTLCPWAKKSAADAMVRSEYTTAADNNSRTTVSTTLCNKNRNGTSSLVAPPSSAVQPEYISMEVRKDEENSEVQPLMTASGEEGEGQEEQQPNNHVNNITASGEHMGNM